MISLRVEGRLISKKNKLRRSSHGGMFYDHKVHPVVSAIQAEALQTTITEPLHPDEPFGIVLVIYCKAWGWLDVDGGLTTVLDALQGIVYENDRMCAEAVVKKVIIAKKEKPYFTIEVYRP